MKKLLILLGLVLLLVAPFGGDATKVIFLGGGGGGGIASVSEDLTPTLGGELDADSNKIVNLANPTASTDAVNLHTLLENVELNLHYWFGSGTLDILLTDSEDVLIETPDADPKTLTTITFKSLVADTPAPFLIKAGAIISIHYAADVTVVGGRHDEQLKFQLGYVDADGTSNFSQIGADSDLNAVLTATKTLYANHIHVSSDTTVPSGKRLWLKVIADATLGGSGYPEIGFYFDSVEHHLSFGIGGEVLDNFVLKSGSTMSGALGVPTIELGHVSDTTIARSGAGDITVEGNQLYRAGGTDVADADVVDDLTVSSTKVITGLVGTVMDVDGFTMSALQGRGYVVYATGAGVIVMPPALPGSNFSVEVHAAAAVVLAPDASGTEDTIRLDGVALTQGLSITSTSTAGDVAVCTHFATDVWSCITNGWNVANDFIFTITTLVEDDSFTLAIYDGGTYAFNVDWGDSSNDYITAFDDAAVTHTYADSGASTYTITITGTIIGWRFNDAGDKTLIQDIQQWGTLQLGNIDNYFNGCSNLTVTATDNLDITGTTSYYLAFRNATSLTTIPSINSWGMSAVGTFRGMFMGATSFNQDIGSWDVSSLTDTRDMFNGAIAFDQDIGDWDISVLAFAAGMFTGVTLSTANYNALLIGWEANAHQNNVIFSGGNSKYSAGTAATARAALVTDGWTITDGGQE